MRRSVVARVSIPAGAVITSDALTFKRPGTGISPTRLDDVIGTRARIDIEADQLIRWRDVER
jgi:N-acetylneuraminate synthase